MGMKIQQCPAAKFGCRTQIQVLSALIPSITTVCALKSVPLFLNTSAGPSWQLVLRKPVAVGTDGVAVRVGVGLTVVVAVGLGVAVTVAVWLGVAVWADKRPTVTRAKA